MTTAFLFGILALVLLVLGLFYWVGVLLEDRIRRQLRQGGADREAVVTDHQVLRQERGLWTTIYYVQYRYYYQGQRYEQKEQVGPGRYNAWPRGTLISVRYLPQHPHVVRITSEENQFLLLGKILIGCGIFLMAVALLFTLTL